MFGNMLLQGVSEKQAGWVFGDNLRIIFHIIATAARFCTELNKIILQLSSNTHHICFTRSLPSLCVPILV